MAWSLVSITWFARVMVSRGRGPFKVSRCYMSSNLRRARTVAILIVIALSGCSNDDSPAEDREGLRMCCEMGAYCHPPAGVIADEERQNCHNVGHANDPEGCRAKYDGCMALCADNADASEHYCAE